MDTSIIVAVVSGGLALAGTLATVWGSQKRLRDDIMSQLSQHNAVQDERIRVLTESVERHNNVIERTYQLEGRVECLSRRVSDLSSRTGSGNTDC